MDRTLKRSLLKTGGLILIIVIIASASTLTWVPYTRNFEFLGPWLTWNDDPRTTVVINWWLSESMPGYVIFWNNTYSKKIISETPQRIHHIKLENLTPGAVYFYVVGVIKKSIEVNMTKIYHFKTAPANETYFKFLVMGDEQFHFVFGSSTESAMHSVRREADTDFIISLGDQVETDRLEITWKRFFYNLGDYAANRTIMPVIGNHEWMELDSNHAENYLKFFPLPGNKTYYHFEYSNAVFIALSLFDYTNYTLPESEKEFIRSIVNKAKSEGKWVIVYYHVPTITAYGEVDSDTKFDILNFLGEIKPHLVLTGHTHAYCRIDVNGSKFVNLGSVGGVPEVFAVNTDQRHGYKIEAWSFEYGYAVVEVYGNNLHFVYKSIYGEVLDEFEITI